MEISIDMCVVSVDVVSPFVALFYVCADAASVRDIIVGDQLFTIRQNLWDFLHQAQESVEQGPDCINAPCINAGTKPSSVDDGTDVS